MARLQKKRAVARATAQRVVVANKMRNILKTVYLIKWIAYKTACKLFNENCIH